MSKISKLSLFSYLFNNPEISNIQNGSDFHSSSLKGAALLTAISFHLEPKKLFFLFPTIYEAEEFFSALSEFLNENECYLFPYDEIFRSTAIGISPEMFEERLLSLSSTIEDKPSILIAHTSSFMLSLMDKKRYTESLIYLEKNEMYDVNELLKKLVILGYVATDYISASGQFAQRGMIIDIFDPCYKDPIRLELFGDELEDIRSFKVKDEMSYKHLEKAIIHPFSLRVISQEEKEEGIKRIDEAFKQIVPTSRNDYDGLQERIERLKEDVLASSLKEVDQRFYPFFNEKTATLSDYLEDYSCYIYNFKEIREEYKELLENERAYFKRSYKSFLSLEGEKVFSDSNFDLTPFKKIINDDSFILRSPSFQSISFLNSKNLLQDYEKEGYQVFILLKEPNYTNYLNYLNNNQLTYSIYPNINKITITDEELAIGLELPSYKKVYLSAKEIFGISSSHTRFLSRYKDAKIIRRYEDLKPGDYVVHEIHGVGLYEGVEVKEGLECLKISYAEGARAYVPLSQYKMIRKYSSREGYTPTLDRLGGSTWARKKEKIKSKISFIADQLLAIYASRKEKIGHSYSSEDELENNFIRSFSFTYTPSQLEACKAIKEDMESPYPMDRLIAGDVGFGKTEVAFYAAFKACLDHKQVAFLCPTTILANQHYKVALERFNGLGVKIAMLSRFISQEEQKKVIEKIKKGEIDIVIGTHRLLSDDIKFKDIGLLIIDEEQKFGVTHKEKIKERYKDVDCLTLSATPIPRTMQMSLLSVRQLSILESPPLNRMPVKTYVIKMDDELTYEVIAKELERKGQVYYLHNNISSLFSLKEKIQKKFPDHKVEAIHARMREDEIENIMNDFYIGNIDILVCTTIVESGLDIPNVNTIIVDNADHFGLAQLYQIKGRVGRSDRLAYAYFFFKDQRKMSDEAKKRLKALKDFTELGSGYKIAMQDLNIRGAGDILGSKQSGFVDSLGYEAYVDLLNTVIKEKKLAKVPKEKKNFELLFSLDAHIPSSYGNEEQRISMYRELSDCDNDKSLSLFAKKLKDVYGPYPLEVENLLLKKKIENILNNGSFASFAEELGYYDIILTKEASSKPKIYKELEEKLEGFKDKLRVRIDDYRFEFIMNKTSDYLNDLLYLLSNIMEVI